MPVNQLCDGTMGNSTCGTMRRGHCVAKPWRLSYGGGVPWQSLNCVMAQCAIVHLNYGQESIV
jgi:hypothetical protein